MRQKQKNVRGLETALQRGDRKAKWGNGGAERPLSFLGSNSGRRPVPPCDE